MKKTALIALLVLSLAAAGCATEQEARYTTSGAGVGAVTGGILGGILGSLSGHAGQGMVVGSIFGGLAGASIGNNEYHLQRSEEQASQYYGYNEQDVQRDLLRIEDATANPQNVYPGEDVHISTTFTLLSPGRGSRMVHEVLQVKRNGRVIGKPEFTSRRKGGTWVSTVPVRIPPDAEPGTYKVTAIVETDNAGDSRDISFVVTPKSSWRR